MKKYLHWLWHCAHARNTDNILDLLEPNPEAHLLDLGCDDGSLTVRFADRLGTAGVSGCDFITEVLQKAQRRDIQTKRADLNQRLPYPTNHFDVATSNQVIEHLFETDTFVEEIFRVLKPGGYAVISTENLSSWHNIFALTLGHPAFSQHVSSRKAVGNPLSLVAGEKLRPGWSHVKIFTLRGLTALLQLHGFTVEASRGSGYYPLPPLAANPISKVSPGHSAFITVKVRKPKKR